MSIKTGCAAHTHPLCQETSGLRIEVSKTWGATMGQAPKSVDWEPTKYAVCECLLHVEVSPKSSIFRWIFHYKL